MIIDAYLEFLKENSPFDLLKHYLETNNKNKQTTAKFNTNSYVQILGSIVVRGNCCQCDCVVNPSNFTNLTVSSQVNNSLKQTFNSSNILFK